MLPLAPQVTYKVPTFDVDAMLIEIGLMLEWYLPDRDVQPSQVLRAEFLELWRDLLEAPLAAKPHLGDPRLPLAEPALAARARRHRRASA